MRQVSLQADAIRLMDRWGYRPGHRPALVFHDRPGCPSFDRAGSAMRSDDRPWRWSARLLAISVLVPAAVILGSGGCTIHGLVSPR